MCQGREGPGGLVGPNRTRPTSLASQPKWCGMFAGMIDPEKPHGVLKAIGQDNLNRLGISVRATRQDLAEYRRALPRLAARHTNRGLLNWIHDQYFANVLATFENVEGRSVRDEEPIRELYLGSLLRFRFKAHDATDMVSSYPTTAFQEFAAQEQLLPEVRLIAGYRWDKEAGQIGEAVVTARNGRNNVLWSVMLGEDRSGEDDEGVFTPRPAPDLPSLPSIGVIEGGITGRREREEA